MRARACGFGMPLELGRAASDAGERPLDMREKNRFAVDVVYGRLS